MKIACEACGKMGQLQHLSKNYYRVKHYLGSVNGKLKFEYHKQSFQYVQRILNQNEPEKNIDPIDQSDIDLKLFNNSFNSKNTGRGCPSLVGGRPAKSVVSNGRVGSNPTPRAIKSDKKTTSNLNPF